MCILSPGFTLCTEIQILKQQSEIGFPAKITKSLKEEHSPVLISSRPHPDTSCSRNKWKGNRRLSLTHVEHQAGGSGHCECSPISSAIQPRAPDDAIWKYAVSARRMSLALEDNISLIKRGPASPPPIRSCRHVFKCSRLLSAGRTRKI